MLNIIQEFIDFKNKIHSEIRGGKLMFDLPNHYKWISEDELFDYYINKVICI